MTPPPTEHLHRYTFARPGLVCEALTHCSWSGRNGSCYQRLEFLGDALLDLVVVQHCFDSFTWVCLIRVEAGAHETLRWCLRSCLSFPGLCASDSCSFITQRGALTHFPPPPHPPNTRPSLLPNRRDVEPSDLHDMRSVAVNAERLAFVAVHHGLQRHIRHASPKLLSHLTDFVSMWRDEVRGGGGGLLVGDMGNGATSTGTQGTWAAHRIEAPLAAGPRPQHRTAGPEKPDPGRPLPPPLPPSHPSPPPHR